SSSRSIAAGGRSSVDLSGRCHPKVVRLRAVADMSSAACLGELPPPFGVYFDRHQTITMTMYHLRGAILSAVDRGCPEAHFVCLAVDLASEVLQLDGEAQIVAKARGERLCVPGLVVKRLSSRRQ